MKDSLRQDLKQLICEGNIAKLPNPSVYTMSEYKTVRSMLLKANGKYKRNTFEFPFPAKVIIDTLLSGKVIDFKKEFQFFATPDDLAQQICNDIVWDKEQMDILEPSAGHGVFIDTVLNLRPDIPKIVDAVELAELNFKVLQEKYKEAKNINLVQGDFLKYNPKKKYDLILANPPFNKNQDIDHIRHMFSMLKKGGQLLTIASSSWTFGQQKKQKAFKAWLEDEIAASWVDLESGAFRTSGTMVKGTYINICK